jgi:hypothetical protein
MGAMAVARMSGVRSHLLGEGRQGWQRGGTPKDSGSSNQTTGGRCSSATRVRSSMANACFLARRSSLCACGTTAGARKKHPRSRAGRPRRRTCSTARGAGGRGPSTTKTARWTTPRRRGRVNPAWLTAGRSGGSGSSARTAAGQTCSATRARSRTATPSPRGTASNLCACGTAAATRRRPPKSPAATALGPTARAARRPAPGASHTGAAAGRRSSRN